MILTNPPPHSFSHSLSLMEDSRKLNPTATTVPTFQLHEIKANNQQQSDEIENEGADCIFRIRTHNRRKKRTSRDNNIQRKKGRQVMRAGGDDDDDDHKEELERKIVALQRIVPGGETLLGVDKLFEETADYILALQCQIEAMKVLTNFIEGYNRNFGA